MKKMTLLGALIALVLVVFPVAPARATQCDEVFIYYDYDYGRAEMETGTPSPRTIFYTLNGANPTHNSATPGSGTFIYYGPISIPYGQRRHFTALCYKAGYEDSIVTNEWFANPPD
jgi:Chitobiase/beta-hexosaminidase C-terminal domain